MDDYLTKPMKLEDLLAMAAKWAPASAAPAPTPEPMLEPSKQALDPAKVASLRSLAGNSNAPFFTQLFETYVADSGTRIAALRQAARDRDSGRVRAEAHALAGASLNVGAAQVGELARAAEALGTANDLCGIDPVIEQLEEAFDQSRLEIMELVEPRDPPRTGTDG